MNTVCTHHNIDINHLHTLEKQQQRAELKRRMQTSRTQLLLKDNQKNPNPVNIVNKFSSETLQKIRLSCHEVEATMVLENVMKVYTFLRRIRYKKLTQLCVKWFQNRNRND